MGHAVNLDRQYRSLQRQLDRAVTGAPPSPVLIKILRLLYRPEEVGLASRLPLRLTVLEELAARLEMPAESLLDRLTAMAHRGLIIDLEHKGRRYFSLAPLALGFFEFTFMRTREDLPLGDLARLFDEYMREDGGGIYRSVFRGPTQIGRTLVNEQSLPEEDHTEVLDWERASHVIQTASAVAVGLCACRHKASHLGQACDKPQRVCLTLNYSARSVIRNGFAEPISTAEAMRILALSKESGLVQIADNVQRRVGYLCNCCGCCCEMFHGVKIGKMRSAITTSNWIMAVDPQKCSGCGRCAMACPMDAIEMAVAEDAAVWPKAARDGRFPGNCRRVARLHEDLCIGCGVCNQPCTAGAISMRPRAQRVFSPQTILDRMALMAIERNRLADFIFDRQGPISHRLLVRLVAILEKTPLLKAAIAIKPLRSAFLQGVVAAAQKQLGPLSEVTQ